MTSPDKTDPVVRAFKTTAPAYISYITKKGSRFSLPNGHIKTSDPEIIETLEEQLKVTYSEITEIDPSEVPDAGRPVPRKHQLELNSSDTITPAELMARVRAARESAEAKPEVSPQLEAIAARANVGITTSTKLNGNAVESNNSGKQ